MSSSIVSARQARCNRTLDCVDRRCPAIDVTPYLYPRPRLRDAAARCTDHHASARHITCVPDATSVSSSSLPLPSVSSLCNSTHLAPLRPQRGMEYTTSSHKMLTSLLTHPEANRGATPGMGRETVRPQHFARITTLPLLLNNNHSTTTHVSNHTTTTIKLS